MWGAFVQTEWRSGPALWEVELSPQFEAPRHGLREDKVGTTVESQPGEG